MIEVLSTTLAAFAKEHPILSLIVVGIGALDYIQWLFGKIVLFSHRMRLHWRKLRAEPDPHLVNN